MSVTGVLLLDKAKGPTSHDVVQSVREITRQRRVGHTGTLDPFATGLLVLCLGRATRIARFFSGMPKSYIAVVRFGYATDTYDATGRRVGPVKKPELTPETLVPILESLAGVQEQVPPQFAAKKFRGRRMYRLARAGVAFEAAPVRVVVHRITLVGIAGERATVELDVGAGTYVRSIAHELGERIGCGAHLEELRRTRVGPFSVQSALDLEQLGDRVASASLGQVLLEPGVALASLPALRLGAPASKRVRHGGAISGSDLVGDVPEISAGVTYRLLGPEGDLLAVGESEGDRVHVRPRVVLADPQKDG